MSKPIIFPNAATFAKFVERNGLDVITSEAELFTVLTSLGADAGEFFVLNDCIKCLVTEERNGVFELELEYPVDGNHYDAIELMAILGTKSTPSGTVQYFRINRITKPINGIITVYASHISYDLTGYICQPGWSATTPYAAMQGIKSHAVPNDCPFYMTSEELGITSTFSVDTPQTCRSLLGGQRGSILDVYGGELSYDNYSIILRKNRGADRGVVIAYGKNLIDLTQEENCASVYTGVYPYWVNEDVVSQLPERVINAAGQYQVQRIFPLDLSNDFETQPTEEQLRQAAESYITSNNIGVPKISLKVSFVQLEKTEEYKGKALLERIDLCDTVTVRFAKIGVNAKAKCVKTVYNALLDRHESIELGDAKTNIAQTIVDTEKTAASAVTTSAMERAVTAATQAITGNLGGYVVLHDSNGDGTPDEILIMDTPDINTATKVWRWNNGGLGYSGTGYAGTYGTAINQNGEIVADFITTGLLSANLIKAGTITNNDDNLSIDVTNGIIRTTDTRFDTTGSKKAEYSGISVVHKIGETPVSYFGFADAGTASTLSVYNQARTKHVALYGDTGNINADGSVTAAGAIIGSNIDSGGLRYNGRYYYPMDIDFKDGRGVTQVMHILCAGLN